MLLLQRILTVLVLGGTLVTAVISLTTPSEDGSSEEPDTPAPAACDYELPDVPVQRQLATIQEELIGALNTWRKEENVQMVQHHLPLDKANAYEFVEAFRSSPDHVAALRDRRMTTAAVGVAYNDGEVYVVIQLEE